MRKILLNSWPFVLIVFVVLIFFWKVIFQGQVPIPGDFIVGTYFPWLDYKWGYVVGVPVKNPITSDVVSIVYPLRSYAVDVLKNGHLPLWNPLMFGGTPILPDFQVGIFSPTIIFYFLLPKIWAWTVQVMLQPLLAAFFMYLLLRNFSLGKIESVFGGLFFAFAGSNIIWLEYNTNSLVAAFIPLLILLVDRYIKTRKIYWLAALSLGICFQIFSGYPQFVLYTLAALVVFVIFRWKEVHWRQLFFIMFFIVTGILLAAVLVVPGLEFILNSQRKYEILERNLIYFPWQNLVTFFAPDYFGNPATKNYFGVGNYTLNTGYSGVIVLMLSIVGVVNKWRRSEVKFFSTLFVLSLLLALPTPLARAIFDSHIPAVSASSAARALVLANLALAALASFGIAGLLKRKKVRNVGLAFVPFAVLIFLLIFTFVTKFHIDITLRNLILPIGLSAMAIVSLILRRKLLIFILCLIAILELFRYGWKFTPFSSPGLVFPETPVLSFFKTDTGIYRISPGDVLPMNMWVPYGLESASGYDALFPIWWAHLSRVIGGGNPNDFNISYYLPFYRYKSPWFDLLNNKYILVNTTEAGTLNQIQTNPKFEKVFQDKSVSIFKNKAALPRAFLVTDWEVRSEEESLAILADPNFSLGEKIIINGPADLQKSSGAKSEVSYELYLPEKSVINVETDKEGFLFVSDAWYPGWTATVDGRNISIFRADYAFRAVPVSKGIHKVEFIYKPESLRVGELVSLVTLIFLAGVTFYDLKIYEKVFSK